MMRAVQRFSLAAATALVLSGSLVLQTGDPAKAGDFSGYVTDYLLSVPGEQLYSKNTAAAKAAWAGNMEAFAGRSAAAYSAAAMYGNVTPDRIAGVVPINSIRNPDIGPGTRWQQLKNWASGGTGKFSVPWSGTSVANKPPKVGVGGALVAVTGFAYRAELANGAVQLMGMDANSLVCSGGDNGITAVITGQDCSGYHAMLETMVPNDDILWHPEGVLWSSNSIIHGTTAATLKICSIEQVTVIGVTLTVKCRMDVNGYGTTTNDSWAVECINTTTNNITGTSKNTLLVAVGQMMTYTHTCATGTVPYAAGGSRSITVPTSGTYERDGTRASWWRHEFTAGHHLSAWAWFSGHSPLYAAEPELDPDRQIQCAITWSNSTTTTALSPSFKESDGAFPEPVCPAAPAGAQPQEIVLTVIWPGGSYEYYRESSTPEFDEFVDEHAECFEYACFLDVVQLATGLSCFSQTITDSCRDWFTDPARDTKYQCQYGGKNKPMQSCYVYANVFKAEKRAEGLAYVDPATGEEIPGAVTSTRADEYLMGQGIRPGGAAATRNCWGSVVSLNPLDWVLRPVQCAFEWAFVPRPSVLAQAQHDLETSYANTPPGQIATVVGGWAIAPIMTGCKIEFEHWTTGQVLPIVDACPGTWFAPVAGISRNLSVVAAVVLSVSLIRRQIAGTVDYKGN